MGDEQRTKRERTLNLRMDEVVSSRCLWSLSVRPSQSHWLTRSCRYYCHAAGGDGDGGGVEVQQTGESSCAGRLGRGGVYARAAADRPYRQSAKSGALGYRLECVGPLKEVGTRLWRGCSSLGPARAPNCVVPWPVRKSTNLSLSLPFPVKVGQLWPCLAAVERSRLESLKDIRPSGGSCLFLRVLALRTAWPV